MNPVVDTAREADWSPGMTSPTPESLAEEDLQRLAETFAVSPTAVRMAVARVGTDFRDVQRQLGGRR